MTPERRRPQSNVSFLSPIQVLQHRGFSNSGDMPSSQTGLYPETFPASSHPWAVLGLRQEESLPRCPAHLLVPVLPPEKSENCSSIPSIASAFFTRRFDWGQRQSRRVAHPRTSWIFYSVSVTAHGLGEAETAGGPRERGNG